MPDRRTTIRSETGSTIVAASLVLGAVVAAGVVITNGSDSDARTTSEPRRAQSTPGFHVGTVGCDDANTAELARDPATPWCTVARAASLTPDGGTVLIAPGTYDGLDVAQGGRPGLTFRAADPSRPPLLHGARVVKQRGYRLEGLRFDRGVSLRTVRDVVLADNELVGAGVYVRQSSAVTIARNRIRGLRGEKRAVMLQGSYAPGQRVNEGIRIVGNRVTDVDHDAIGVYNGYRDLQIRNNRIEDVHQPGGVSFHSDGLQMMGGENALIDGNVFQDVTHGIIVKDGRPTTGLVIRRNLVVRVGGAALQLYNAPGTVLEHNTFWSALLGVVLDDADGVAGSTSARLVDNVLLDVSARTPGAIAGARGNVIGRGAQIGRRGYRGRPKFIDPARGDYRLRTNDPGAGIRRGTVVPGAQQRARP